MRRQLASSVRRREIWLQPISRRLLFNLSPVAVIFAGHRHRIQCQADARCASGLSLEWRRLRPGSPRSPARCACSPKPRTPWEQTPIPLLVAFTRTKNCLRELTGAGLPSNFHYDFHGSRDTDDGNLPLMQRQCPVIGAMREKNCIVFFHRLVSLIRSSSGSNFSQATGKRKRAATKRRPHAHNAVRIPSVPPPPRPTSQPPASSRRSSCSRSGSEYSPCWPRCRQRHRRTDAEFRPRAAPAR
jgi:hypothetical protein